MVVRRSGQGSDNRNMVRLKNGILAAPRKGPAPTAPPNYVVDPNDPYVFYPVIPKCKLRSIIVVRDKKCNCDKAMYFCDNKCEIDQYKDCHLCTKYK